jgi:multiple RNA-binding domain-containing protein 1
MSRLIVKNLPKHISEEDLAKHFAQKGGVVTDAKIMVKNGRSRLFGFVGFKNEEEAKKAQTYFNNTYLHTSRLQVDFSKAQNDPNLARPWSKHS